LECTVVGVIVVSAAIQIAEVRQRAPRVHGAGAGRVRRIDGVIAELPYVPGTDVSDVESKVRHQLALDRQIPLLRVRRAILGILWPAADGGR
jgi:hypothetical protein